MVTGDFVSDKFVVLFFFRKGEILYMEAVLSNSSFAYQSYKKKTMKKVQNLKPKLLLTSF